MSLHAERLANSVLTQAKPISVERVKPLNKTPHRQTGFLAWEVRIHCSTDYNMPQQVKPINRHPTHPLKPQ